MAEYRLERLNDENAYRWDEFNTASPEGTLFHSLRWKQIIEKDSEIKRQYYLLFKDDDVFGLFPFVEYTIRFFGGLFPASDPPLHVILKDFGDPFAVEYAISELRQIAGGRKKISYLCFSTLHEETLDTITTYPLFPHTEDGDMVLNLSESSPEQIWSALSKKRRNKIQSFDKDGFELTEVQSLDDLKLFYQHYESNIKTIGGELRSFSHFAELFDSLRYEIRITLLSKGSIVAGGTLILQDTARKTAHGTYLSLNRNLPNKYSPSYYLYWEAVNWAWENNFEKFSFGQQREDENNPRYRMKNYFGARFEPVYSRMIPLTGLFNLRLKSKNYLAQQRSDQGEPIGQS